MAIQIQHNPYVSEGQIIILFDRIKKLLETEYNITVERTDFIKCNPIGKDTPCFKMVNVIVTPEITPDRAYKVIQSALGRAYGGPIEEIAMIGFNKETGSRIQKEYSCRIKTDNYLMIFQYAV